MIRTRMAAALSLALALASAHTVKADVTSQEKTLVKFEGMLGRMVGLFGGKAAREGVTSTVAVKGDRKLTRSGDTGQIIDLAEEKVYDVDFRRKEYKVTTFAELRRELEEARRKAEEEARKAEAEARSEPAEPDQPAERDPNQKEMEIDFDVKETGQKKAINGFDTRQFIVTITMREEGRTLEESGGLVLTTDTWIAPTIAAMKEVAEFDMRYWQAVEGSIMAGASPQDMAAALAMYPGLREGLGRMQKETANMDGTAIMTTMTVEAVKSAEQLAAEKEQAAESQPSTRSGGIGGLIGGLGRRAAQRNQEAPKARSTFMTTTHEVLKVATAVNDADVAVPAGFEEGR